MRFAYGDVHGLGQNAQLAFQALQRHEILKVDTLAAVIKIQHFEAEAARDGLDKLERCRLAWRNGNLWELSGEGRELAASGPEPGPFVA